MSELIMTIAMLCSIGTGSSPGFVDDAQLKCQQYYIRCAKITENSYPDKSARRLPSCILQRR
jgi:hypothetical protein